MFVDTTFDTAGRLDANEHDPQVHKDGEGDIVAESTDPRQALRYRCLTFPNSAASSVREQQTSR